MREPGSWQSSSTGGEMAGAVSGPSSSSHVGDGDAGRGSIWSGKKVMDSESYCERCS